MTRNDVNDIIRRMAEKHGFQTSNERGWHGFADILSEELNFNFHTEMTDNTDWKAGVLEQTLTITASVRRMGGQPSADELMKTADEIKRGAELVCAFQGVNLTWRETLHG